MNDRKRQEYFQTNLLFLGLQPFRGVECFSRTSKIAVFPDEVSMRICEGTSFRCWKPIFSGMLRFPFLSGVSWKVAIYLFIYLCFSFLFYLFIFM